MAKITSVSLPDDLDKALDLACDERELSRSRLIREAVQFYIELDAAMLRNAQRLAMRMNITTAQVVGNLVTSKLAELDAYQELFGCQPDMLSMFAFADGNRLIEGAELYQMLKRFYGHRLELERISHLLDAEAQGVPLTTADRAWLDARRRGE